MLETPLDEGCSRGGRGRALPSWELSQLLKPSWGTAVSGTMETPAWEQLEADGSWGCWEGNRSWKTRHGNAS